LERARMTQNGKLTTRYAYLQDYVDGKEWNIQRLTGKIGWTKIDF
jgi:hypothetical protein